MSTLTVRTEESLLDIAREDWDALIGPHGSPFLEWDFLARLEETRCVATETGWLPRHLTVRNPSGTLIGGCPVYAKTHSMGEFVFDHGWAEAAQQAGLQYYPKLLVAVPFTPVPGQRLLSHPDADRDSVVAVLGGALRQMCEDNDLSSVHVNFCTAAESVALAEHGFEARRGYQYHWNNRGWSSWDAWLADLRHKKRKQIRRERRELDDRGISLRVLAGDEIPDSLIHTMFELYRGNLDRFGPWGRQYLSLSLFEGLAQRWRHRLCIATAECDGKVIAGAFNVRKGDAMYGRYWGAFERVPFLHFGVCYYAAIEYCLDEGIARYEAGAQGEFKRSRGFDAVPTASVHLVRNRQLAKAVRAFLEMERTAVDERLDLLADHTALRRPS